MATIVRNAVAVPRGDDMATIAPFRATRISRLVLTASRLPVSETYYSRLLGDAQASGGAYRSFQVGPSTVTVVERGSPSLRIALAAFDQAMAHKDLLSLGITPQTSADPAVIALRDPDGLAFELVAAD